MGSFREQAQEHYNPALRDQSWTELLKVEFPEITAAIQGDPEFPGKKGAMPPLTLMIYSQDGRLRFSLSNRDYPRSFFGSVKDCQHVLESIEYALMTGEGDWHTKRQNGR